jgi:2-C-methyl-D-erythritol 4-phosphate cytidylyltransferase
MGGVEKASLPLRGVPMLLHVLRPFLEHPLVHSIVVALPPGLADPPPRWLSSLDDPRLRTVAGGRTRTESVRNGLAALDDRVEVVLVHDAARPLVTRPMLDRCIAGVGEREGVVIGWPVVDTLKSVDGTGRVTGTPDRSALWRAQTPQGFPAGPIRAAYASAVESGWEATDDATVFARWGGSVRMAEGSPWNLKVTHPDDVPVAEFLLRVPEGDLG